MRIFVVGSRVTGWELVLDGQMEPLGVAENMSFEEALDAFAANWPEYAEQLDEFKCEDFVGVTEKTKRERNFNGSRGVTRKRGSGARFRELILQGKTNVECVQIVRSEFPESTATLSDAAWNRAELRKNPGKYGSNGTKM